MLKSENTALVFIDVQGKLAQLMHKKQFFFENLKNVVKGVQVLDIPIIWLEQCPDKLGATTPEISQLLSDCKPIAKTSFSACRSTEFMQALKATKRQQVLLVGLEAHICVYQTARDLVKLGYQVDVVSDAVASRIPENKQVGLQRMQDCGVRLSTTEMALFELLEVAEGQQFKEIIKIIS